MRNVKHRLDGVRHELDTVRHRVDTNTRADHC